MLILFGILGLMQVTLLPALIIMKAGKLRGGVTEQLIRLLPISLTANYLLIFLLAALHLYIRPVMLVLIAAELLCILWLYRGTLFQPVNLTVFRISEALRQELRPLTDALSVRPDGRSGTLRLWIWMVSGCLALSGVLWGFHLCRLNFGTVFSGWDTLFSWNAYAETWAAGRIPKVAGMYPQLVSSNWSVSYLLQGENAVQFFNTLLPPVFFLLIQVMLFDLGFQRRESAFFFAAVIARFMMKKLMGDQLFDGYMDVPVAAMSLLSVYTFLKAENRDPAEQRQGIVLGVLFAAAAAVTKQSGWIAFVFSPLAVFLLLREGAKTMSGRNKTALCAAALLIVMPWYLYCLLGKTPGTERELIANGIMDFNQRFDLRYRLELAVSTLGKYGICFLLSLAGLLFVPKKYRLLFFLMAWPLTVIWAVSYSYDARNLGPVLPFISILCGMALTGIGNAAEKIAEKTGFGKIPLLVFLVLLAAAGIAGLVRRYPDGKLIDDQRDKQKALFGERLNRELLYDVFGETHEGHDIYTDYPAYFLSGYRDCCSAADLTDEGQVRSILEGTKIRWLMLPEVMPNDTDPSKALIEQCIDAGICELTRCSDGYYKSYCLYEVKR